MQHHVVEALGRFLARSVFRPTLLVRGLQLPQLVFMRCMKACQPATPWCSSHLRPATRDREDQRTLDVALLRGSLGEIRPKNSTDFPA
jgi:hypothetical protein